MTVNTDIEQPEGVQQARAYIEQLEAERFGWDIAVGDAFVRGMRDIGYKSTAYAVAELVDNAIQAEANRIDVVFGFDSGTKPSKMAIIDDGHGMDPKMVRASLVWGAGTRAGDRSGFGKYGYGLPSASVSQCRRVTIYSKTAGGQWHSAFLDVDEISDGAWTKGNRIEMPPAIPAELPDFVRKYLAKSKRSELTHGTVVVWDRTDRVKPKTRDHLRSMLLTQMGLIYRNSLVKVPMTVDEQPVEPCDPLFLTEGYRYYDLDEDRAVAYPGEVVEVIDKESGSIEGRMRIRFARMPASFFRKPEFKNNYKSGRGSTNERLDIADANNGIIFLRNGRQIDVVRPPRKIANFNATTDRFWSVEVDFDASLDDLFAITTSKQQVTPEDRVWDILKDKGKVFAAIAVMRHDYAQDAKAIRYQAERAKESEQASVAAIEASAKFRTTSRPKDTPERREEAASNLKKEAGKRAKKAGIDPEVVERELTAKQEGTPRVVEIDDLPGAPFFRCIQRGGQRVLGINRDHPFYEELYMSPRSSSRLRSGLEVLLWALGEAEADADPGTDRRKFYERERATVWSPFLADTLTALGSLSIFEDTEPDESDGTSSQPDEEEPETAA